MLDFIDDDGESHNDDEAWVKRKRESDSKSESSTSGSESSSSESSTSGSGSSSSASDRGLARDKPKRHCTGDCVYAESEEEEE